MLSIYVDLNERKLGSLRIKCTDAPSGVRKADTVSHYTTLWLGEDGSEVATAQFTHRYGDSVLVLMLKAIWSLLRVKADLLVHPRNRAKCRKCGTVIESTHQHDYVTCKCEAIALDGGLYGGCWRRAGNLDDFVQLRAETGPRKTALWKWLKEH